MKLLSLLFLLGAFSFNLVAQEDDIEVSSRFGKSDRLMVDIYSDMWLNAPDTILFKDKNPGASVSLMQDFPFGATNFSFAIGLGIGTHNMRSDASLYVDSNNVSFFSNMQIEPKQNKLVLSFVDVPIELRFRTKRENVFRFAIGGKFGYMINNHIKYVDNDEKTKTFKVDNINPLRYGVTARFGYKMFNVYVYYGLSTLFEDKMGPEMTPLSFGISIIPF
jgi:hypothetical protein